MNAIKAIYDGTDFRPVQPIPVTGAYEVIITFIEPMKKGAAQKRKNTSTKAKLPRSTMKGILKGKVWMSADFNAPLEEMREYME